MSGGGGGIDWGAIGTIGGAIAGVALAPVTGGMSLAGAGLLGASLGGTIGNALEGPKSVDTSFMNPGAGEQALEQRLAAQGAGTGGPSAAEAQLNAGLDRSNANAMALAASQRGISPGLAAALASRQQGMNQVEANQQGSMLRAQEAQGANQLLASMYSSQRGSGAQAAAMQQAASQANDARFDRMLGGIGSAGSYLFSAGAGGGGGGGGGGTNADWDGSFENSGTQYGGGGGGDMMNAKAGGQTYNDISRGSRMLDRKRALEQQAAMQRSMASSMRANKGGKVPGKALVPGDSIKNDRVPALLSPGEIVIPRTVAKKSPEAIAKFVKKLMDKENA